jgi:hypothetical protein
MIPFFFSLSLFFTRVICWVLDAINGAGKGGGYRKDFERESLDVSSFVCKVVSSECSMQAILDLSD